MKRTESSKTITMTDFIFSEEDTEKALIEFVKKSNPDINAVSTDVIITDLLGHRMYKITFID